MAAQVELQRWNRAHRRAMNDWPNDSDPFSWLWSYSHMPTAGPRTSYAIDAGGILAGRIALRNIDSDSGRARLGIYIRPDMRGGGIGRRAIELLLERWFTQLAGSRIDLDVWASNRRAVGLYQQFGFVEMQSTWHDLPNHPALQLIDPLAIDLRNNPPSARCLEMSLWFPQWRRYASGGDIPGSPAPGVCH